MRDRPWLLAAALALAACTAKEPMPITPPGEVAGAPVARRPIPEPAPAVVAKAAPAAKTAPVAAAKAAPAVFPADAIYVCVSESGGERKETVIVFSPKVGNLCRKHPEMGPCQYERDICRRSGGRVYAAGGFEITNQVEAEYDKKVMRVRFKAN
jgi:hypothetical protein